MPPKPIPPELLNLRRQNAVALFVRWRLQEIAQGRPGGDKTFAEVLGISSAQWSRVKTGTPVGAKLARQIEAACGMEFGWLDQEPPQAQAEHTAPARLTGPNVTFERGRIDLDHELGLSKPSIFMARAHGTSMLGKGIDDGDLLVIDKAITPRHGHTVVAIIDKEPLCHTLYQCNGEVKLQSAHPAFADILLPAGEPLMIWGVVTAVIKKLVD